MPSTPRSIEPCSISWPITLRTMFTGMAKPMPMLPPERLMIAALMPTRLPFRSISAPPELPGLMAASVWMKSS